MSIGASELEFHALVERSRRRSAQEPAPKLSNPLLIVTRKAFHSGNLGRDGASVFRQTKTRHPRNICL